VAQLFVKIDHEKGLAVFWGPGTFTAKEDIKTLGSARWNGVDKTWEVRGFRGNQADLETLFPGIKVEAATGGSGNSSLVSELTSTLAAASSFSSGSGNRSAPSATLTTAAAAQSSKTIVSNKETVEGIPRGLSVAEFGARVRLALRDAFPRTVYLYGLVSSVNQKGDRIFLDLAETERPDETLSCAVWRDGQRIFEPLRKAGFELEKDLQIMVEVSVAFNKRGGRISLTVHKVIPEYTLAKAAALREQTNERLKKEGMFLLNKQQSLPFLPTRLGILTSSGGTVINDFRAALDSAHFGFELFWFDVAVQGVEAKRELVRAIQLLSKRTDLDAVLLFRGGGSAGDLSVFNDYDVARAICQCPIPVVSAIGHEEDQSSAQDVSNIAFGVPKDIGMFFASLVFERRRLATKLTQSIIRSVTHLLTLREQRLGDVSVSSYALGSQFVRAQDELLSRFALSIPSACVARVAAIEEKFGRSLATIPNFSERLYDQRRRELQSLAQYVRAGVERLQLLSGAEFRAMSLRLAGQMGSLFEESKSRLSIWREIAQSVRHLISLKERDLSTKEQVISAASPAVQLRRGFSIVRASESGRVLSKRGDIELGAEIEIEFSEGLASAKVIK
jgi:exodeoxyribonuclease VII large subunit